MYAHSRYHTLGFSMYPVLSYLLLPWSSKLQALWYILQTTFLASSELYYSINKGSKSLRFQTFFLTKVDLQALDTYGKAHWWSHGWRLCALNVLFLQSKLRSPEVWFADMWHQPLTIYIIFLENFQSLSKFKVKIRPLRILPNLHMTFRFILFFSAVNYEQTVTET